MNVIDPLSPLSFLQQRLTYMEQNPSSQWTNLLDNVPVWPSGVPKTESLSSESCRKLRSHYADCAGDLELREHIATKETEKFEGDLSAENVQITNGALHAISLVLQAHRKQCDTLVCQTPVFRGVTQCARALGYRVKLLPNGRSGEPSVLLALAQMNERTLLYLNSPNNPTGYTLSESEVAPLVKRAQEVKTCVLLDAVYDDFQYEAIPSYTLDLENLYVFGSMSKAYGCPGLRVGWVVGARERIKPLAARLETQCVSVNSEAQAIALCMLQRGNEELRSHCAAMRQYLKSTLPNIPQLLYQVPQAGLQFYAWLAVHDIEETADYLLTRNLTAFTTSENYEGSPGPYIRIPLGLPLETLQNGILALSDFFSSSASGHLRIERRKNEEVFHAFAS
ncbi:MAG: aminotransferase class I/II-fold pyridoxal phosphate-dependent enzyme [Bdellovibrionales bacterium]|nr:aminotransferase class I/II-fold pyridoxal phosphate-dependent enzyme [Bdellovibrionales bacterium]